MRKGADALKRTVKETDVDKVADVMDDINESMALADELGEAMSQSIGPQIAEVTSPSPPPPLPLLSCCYARVRTS
jgi:hypothetical protein